MFKTPIVYYSVDHVFKGFKLSWGYNISSRSETTTSYPDQWEVLFYKVLPDGKKLDIHKAKLSRESFQMKLQTEERCGLWAFGWTCVPA